MPKHTQPKRQKRPGRLVSTLATAAALAAMVGCGGGASSGASVSTPDASTAPAPTTTTASSGTAAHPATSTSGSTSTQKVEERTPVTERVEISSPVVRNEGLLPARYTCDGENIPPPLRWKGIPAGTAELMLDVIKLNPVNHQLYFSWAVTGLSPNTHGIDAKQLPADAIIGTNGAGQLGYDVCPPEGPSESYVAALFALPHRLPARPGFSAAALRREAERTATYQGFLIFKYTRH
jgi:phosphatidylethanolamine-binding protein (PEBP) family uncharacterized protein